jgi:hypothetical protein
MGFGDRLKVLREQAQQAVVENKDKIQDAVQVVGEAANVRTKGKYSTQITKVGEKVEQSVAKLAQSDPGNAGGAPESATMSDPMSCTPSDPPSPTSTDPMAPAPAEEAATGRPPEFE